MEWIDDSRRGSKRRRKARATGRPVAKDEEVGTLSCTASRCTWSRQWLVTVYTPTVTRTNGWRDWSSSSSLECTSRDEWLGFFMTGGTAESGRARSSLWSWLRTFGGLSRATGWLTWLSSKFPCIELCVGERSKVSVWLCERSKVELQNFTKR